jgi:hypothetical protein
MLTRSAPLDRRRLRAVKPALGIVFLAVADGKNSPILWKRAIISDRPRIERLGGRYWKTFSVTFFYRRMLLLKQC